MSCVLQALVRSTAWDGGKEGCLRAWTQGLAREGRVSGAQTARPHCVVHSVSSEPARPSLVFLEGPDSIGVVGDVEMSHGQEEAKAAQGWKSVSFGTALLTVCA